MYFYWSCWQHLYLNHFFQVWVVFGTSRSWMCHKHKAVILYVTGTRSHFQKYIFKLQLYTVATGWQSCICYDREPTYINLNTDMLNEKSINTQPWWNPANVRGNNTVGSQQLGYLYNCTHLLGSEREPQL